jgi:hypothetical protein
VRVSGPRWLVVTVGALLVMASGSSVSSAHPVTHLDRLTAQWWRWSISMPLSGHPLADPAVDPAAADCTFNQHGKVWFLGGVFNASGTVTRSCVVPHGVSLLVPAINVECSNVEEPPFFGATKTERRICAEGFAMADPFVELTRQGSNTSALPVDQVTSPDFHFKGPDGNVLLVDGRISGRAVSAGWWTLIPPLQPGTYTLHFGGSFPDFDFSLDITYHLTVT